jgi:purine-binding chemotaxis protein CheW
MNPDLSGSVSSDSVEILRQRAISLARVDGGEAASAPAFRVLLFRWAGAAYAIRADFLHEVQPLSRITPIPGLPAAIRGVFAVRGQIWSLVDLRPLVGLPGEDLRPGTFILLRGEHNAFALATDVVEGIVDCLEKEVAPASWPGAERAEPFIAGTMGDGTVLLNAEALLNSRQLVINH